MNRKDFNAELDQLLELPVGTIKGDESLESLAGWDSLAIIGFIAMVDGKFGVVLSTSALGAAKTVGDLAAMLGDRITG